MGSSSSKFRKHLQNGDEYAALQVFQNSPELRRTLDPNCSYGDSLHHNSPLHLVAKHAMKPLLRIFLNELGGNPNKQNAINETALHLACQGNLMRSPSTQERRAACVLLILQWRGSYLSEQGIHEKINLSAFDEEGNTALHYAAATGLKKCVEFLIIHGSPLFIENKDRHTACDLAEKNGYEDIAQLLESKMVFSSEEAEDQIEIGIEKEDYSGLRTQDLQEAKDQLLVETSDMLHVPLFTAEALLRDHEWSRESLLEVWVKDPIACCQKAGVQPPTSALQYCTHKSASGLRISCEQVQEEYQNESLNSPAKTLTMEIETMCDICTNYIPLEEDPVSVPCQHRFCRSCWQSYLTVKIQDGETRSIMCPAFECLHLVPVDIIENLVTPEMVRRYLQFDIEAFVESNRNIKWCPYPECGRAVKLPDSDIMPQVIFTNVNPPPPVSHAVDCGNSHYFCWECLGEAHAPCGCEKWREWHSKIAEIKPEELKNTCSKTEDAANCLWLVTNSKPCPNCKSPIQKNEGCNHMKCSKCKHDYCWVCLEAWKKHSSATGGYFRCNRFEAVQKAEVRAGMLISEAESRNRQMQELKRFVHYYTRFKNHENSHKFEEPLLIAAQNKMESLASKVGNSDTAELETHFLEEAVLELLRARRVLCGSYVYGYYLEDNGYNKTIFEFMQNDLEEATEKLSEMVARHHLQTPRAIIIQTSFQVKRKRQEFTTAVSKGLIPPETPPSMRRTKRRHYPALMGIDPLEDEQLTQAIMASLQELDPQNPWIKDSQGKHTNLAAIYDWPDYDSEEEANSNSALTASLLGVCSRDGCSKPRARNPRNGSIHEHCSLRCFQAEREGQQDLSPPTYEIDYSMDLLIALEMSRLQMIEDTKKKPNETLLEERESSSQEDSVIENQNDPMDISADVSESQPLSNSSDQSLDLCLEQLQLPVSAETSSSGTEIKESNNDSLELLAEGGLVKEEEQELSNSEVCKQLNSLPLNYPSTRAAAIAYFLKNPCDEDLNFKNLNSLSDICSKTDKELFTDVQISAARSTEEFKVENELNEIGEDKNC